METWRFKAKSITKYNSTINKNIEGLEDEWTSYSDIGKDFNGNKLTYLDYISVEEKYIYACLAFFKLIKSNKFQIIDIYKTSKSKDFTKNQDDKILLKYYKDLKTNVEIDEIFLKYYIQLVLREYANFSIQIDKKTNSFIHFGFDYHMYFVSDFDLTILNKDILELNLFMTE